MPNLITLANSILNRRQLIATWLPLLGFLTGLTTIIVSAFGWPATLSWWHGLTIEARALLITALLVLTALLAQVITARRISIIRLYEGYWSRFGAISRALRQKHLKVQEGLSPEDSRFLAYPLSRSLVMPTRLGHLIRAAEEHAQRYGMAAVTVWPRLYVVLPTSFTTTFATAATSLEAMAVTSALGATFAVVGGIFGALVLPWYGAAVCFWAGVLVAWIGYRAMVRAAHPYAALIRAAFDVHRWELLKAMQLKIPTSYGAELRQWRQLGKLWSRGAPDTDGVADLGYPCSVEQPGPQPTLVVVAAKQVREKQAQEEPRKEKPKKGKPDRVWPVRALILTLLLVVGLAIPGFAAIRQVNWRIVPGTEPEPVAAQQLDAFRIITATDVTTQGTLASLQEVVGRYPLRPIKNGHPVRAAELGPRVPDGSLDGRLIVAVTPEAESGIAERLSRGQHVLLRSGQPPVMITDALVLEVTGAGPTTLVVAMQQADVPKLAENGKVRVTLRTG